jgi:endo-1,4-beta-xylanase
LRALAVRHDLVVGTAVDANVLGDQSGYRTELAREFSSVTPENAMKWEVTEPKQGKFDFGEADSVVDFARAHDMRVRAHTLVWHEQNPGWLLNGDFTRAQMVAILRAHIHALVGHYRGRVASWDVVNEPLTDDGKLRQSFWLQRIGPEYIAMAFRFAREADPRVRLFVNEIGAEGTGSKSDRLYELIKSLRRHGVPVDGVGFESHLSLDGVPPSMRANMKRFADLGLLTAVTEADVRVRVPPSDAALRVQAGIYADLVHDCLAVSACRSFTFWGFTDRWSWIPGNQPGYGAATLLDDQLDPKPAYRAVHDALAHG